MAAVDQRAYDSVTGGDVPAWFDSVAAQEKQRQELYLQQRRDAEAAGAARMAAEYEQRRASGRWVRFENQDGTPFYWHSATGGSFAAIRKNMPFFYHHHLLVCRVAAGAARGLCARRRARGPCARRERRV
jgi:hypothetical protein